MTDIAIIGPGAIGSTIAGWLAQSSDLRVSVCARSHFDYIELDTPTGHVIAHPEVWRDPADAVPARWVIVTTKAYDAAGTSTWINALTGPDTRVAILQNGVEHVARFAHLMPEDRLLPAVVDIPAERTSPGRVRQRRMGWIKVPLSEPGQDFAALFAHTPIDVTVTDDFRTVAWEKLCLNCAGAVSALTQKPQGVARRDDIAGIMRDLILECIKVGRAEGAHLSDDLAHTTVERMREADPDGVNSLLADRMAGRPMEIDARNRVIVRLGETHGIATPVNRLVVALLEASA